MVQNFIAQIPIYVIQKSIEILKNAVLDKGRAYMTKAEIVEKVSNKTGLSKKETTELVESVFSLLKSTLENGENVKISGFGKFEVKQKKDRRGRNPQTGDTITIEARRVLSFKPSSVLRTAVNAETAA